MVPPPLALKTFSLMITWLNKNWYIITHSGTKKQNMLIYFFKVLSNSESASIQEQTSRSTWRIWEMMSAGCKSQSVRWVRPNGNMQCYVNHMQSVVCFCLKWLSWQTGYCLYKCKLHIWSDPLQNVGQLPLSNAG